MSVYKKAHRLKTAGKYTFNLFPDGGSISKTPPKKKYNIQAVDLMPQLNPYPYSTVDKTRVQNKVKSPQQIEKDKENANNLKVIRQQQVIPNTDLTPDEAAEQYGEVKQGEEITPDLLDKAQEARDNGNDVLANIYTNTNTAVNQLSNLYNNPVLYHGKYLIPEFGQYLYASDMLPNMINYGNKNDIKSAIHDISKYTLFDVGATLGIPMLNKSLETPIKNLKNIYNYAVLNTYKPNVYNKTLEESFPIQSNELYRVVTGDEPILDAMESNVIRAKSGLTNGTIDNIRKLYGHQIDNLTDNTISDIITKQGEFKNINYNLYEYLKNNNIYPINNKPILIKSSSSNHGNMVHFTKGKLYYKPTKNDRIIVGTQEKSTFAPAHHGNKLNVTYNGNTINYEDYINNKDLDLPVGTSAVLHNNGELKNASSPTKNFYYYQYDNNFGWQPHYFYQKPTNNSTTYHLNNDDLINNNNMYKRTHTIKKANKYAMGGEAFGKLLGNASGDVSGAFGKLSNNPSKDYMDKAIYGDSAADPLGRMFGDITGTSTKSAVNQLNAINPRVNAVNNNDLMAQYNNMHFLQHKVNTNSKDSWAAHTVLPFLDFKKDGSIKFNADNLVASAKGASAGSAFGPWGALAGGIAGGVANLVSYFGRDNRINKINNAIDASNARQLASFNNANTNIAQQNQLNMQANYSANGGTIHINPENRGKFNATKQRTGKTTEELTHSKNPTTRRRAIFAQNAAKWNHHGYGGLLYDDGGNLNSQHGGDFSNGVTQINNGGTHEQNPNEGVQMGTDPNNVPNLVEQGEVIFDDYVYSNRLNVPNSIREKYHMGKKGKLSYADAAKKLSKESEERPNDPISINGLEASMAELMEAQEIDRFKEKMKDPRYAKQIMQQVLQQQYQQQADSQQNQQNQQQNPQQNEEDEMSQEETPNQEIEGNEQGALPQQQMFDEGGDLYPDNLPYHQFVSNSSNLDDDNIWHQYKYPDDYFLSKYRDASGDKNEAKPNTIDTYKETPSYSNPLAAENAGNLNTYVNNYVQDNPVEKKTIPNVGNEENNLSKDAAFARYAPIIGNALNSITDAMGLTNEEDYSNIDKYNRAVENIAPVSASPLGNYMTYKPLDMNYLMNKEIANQAAARSSIRNSGRNRAEMMANMAAANYAGSNAIGDAYIKGVQANEDLRNKINEFNRGTNQINSQQDLQAQQLNQALQLSRAQLLGDVAAKREELKRYAGNARSTNLSNLYSSIGGYGTERYRMNSIKSNPYFVAYSDADGVIHYRGSNGRYITSKVELTPEEVEAKTKEEEEKDKQEAAEKAFGGYLTYLNSNKRYKNR